MTTVSGLFGLADVEPGLDRALREGMAAVEVALHEAVKSDFPFVTETSRHLVQAGGKRFRPLLVLLAAHLGDPGAPGVVPAAVVMELTHLATLYHDDVMDEAALRRGAVSANARWDNTVAILTGDFLFARASDILADLGPEAVRLQARTFERLVTGQIRETVGPQSTDDAVDHYLAVVADKTGSLISTSGRLGAMLAGADDAVVSIMTRFGERIGTAFQLSDDILDVVADSDESGKMPGTDLREGVATLPVLHFRRTLGAGTTDSRLSELLDGDLSDDAHRDEALALLRSHPALDSARADLRRVADDARSVLRPLAPGPVRDALESLCDSVVTRTT